MIKKVFRQMLLTQILSSLTVMICMFVDSVVIGRFLGVNAMTAYGLTNPVLLIFAAFGSMLSAGIQVLCGKTMGRGDRNATDACYTTSLLFGGSAAVLGLILILAFVGPVSTLLGAGAPSPDNVVYSLTRDYLTGFIIGAPAFLLAQILIPYLQMGGKRVHVAAAVVAMTLSDILLDLLNVFVFHGGTFGMGLASSLSYYLALIIGGAWFLRKDCLFRFRPRDARLKLCGELVRGGTPTMVNQISVVLLVFLTNKILLSLSSTLAVAAFSVISTVSNLCTCFGAGIGSVALTLGSVFYGDEDRNTLLTVVRTSLRTGVILGAAVMAAVFLLSPVLVGLFLTDAPEAAGMAVQGMRLYALSLPFSVLVSSMKNYYQGIGRTAFSQLLSFVQSFAFKAVFILLLSRFLGTTGVWLSWLCGEAASLLLLCVVVWKRSCRVSLDHAAYALLPDDLGGGEEFRMTVRDLAGAVEASAGADDFCRRHGVSSRNSTLISLCIEEMVSNIVEHGFTKDRRRDHSVDVRVSPGESGTRIRIRDNCVHFDPVAYPGLHAGDDAASHVGIRMVMKMVKEANYICSLGLNNLTLVV